MKSTTYAVAVLLVLASFGAALWVKAGDLNPPAGPIVPTMHSLDEVYGAVAALNAPPDVVSYYGIGTGSIQLGTADAVGGLVVTDIIVGDVDLGEVYLYQGDPAAGGVVKIRLPAAGRIYQFTSGIPFDAGAEIHARNSAWPSGSIAVTLSGYIPSGT